MKKSSTLNCPSAAADITKLMCKSAIKDGTNLENIESDVMQNRKSGKSEAASEHSRDIIKQYDLELKDLARGLNIEFPDIDEISHADDNDQVSESTAPRSQPMAYPEVTNIHNIASMPNADDILGHASRASASGNDSSSSSSAASSASSASTAKSSHSSKRNSRKAESRRRNAKLRHSDRTMGIDLDASRRHSEKQRYIQPLGVASGSERTQHITEEQEKRSHIGSVMSGIRKETRTTFGTDHERIQDSKANKVERIARLMSSLQSEGMDCSGINMPTIESSAEEINSTLEILRMKNDRSRYSSFAEEILVGGAELIGTVLDGERKIPIVGWQPDYTDYHNTVAVKMHRMRDETSQMVENITRKLDIGPCARIMMELVPSLVLYPHQQRKQKCAPGLFGEENESGEITSDGMSHAFNSIRRTDEIKRQERATLANI